MSPRAAARLTLVAAGLVVLRLAGPAVATDEPDSPASDSSRTTPTAEPAGALSPYSTTGRVPLRRLAPRAELIVSGHVRWSEPFDDDKLLVHHVGVDETLRGTAVATVAVVEIRGTSQRPRLLREETRAVLLLSPAPPLSYLREQLPDGRYHAPIGGRDGIIPIDDATQAELVAGILQEAVAAGELPQGEERSTALRALAFAELRSGNRRLVADALTELRARRTPMLLTSEEIVTLSGTLRDTRIAPSVRIGLIRMLAAGNWAGAAAALEGAEVDTPEVLHAVLAARSALGIPADRAEIRRLLASDDPAVRAAAVEALADLDEPGVMAELAQYATGDEETAVRMAAIEALGNSDDQQAVPVLGQTFSSNDRAIRQASARALLALGEKADTALVDLARTGNTSETRRYAALVLLVARGREHASVQRLLATDGLDPGVVRVLEDGLQFRGDHRHE